MTDHAPERDPNGSDNCRHCGRAVRWDRPERGLEHVDWYAAPDSECPECGHGPAWHTLPDGCARENPHLCTCRRVYAPDATGPGDYVDTSLGTMAYGHPVRPEDTD